MKTSPRRQWIAPAPRAFLAIAIAGIALAGCARTGAIQGRVHLPKDPRPGDAVVLAWRESDDRPEPSEEPVRVIQSRGRFLPRLVVVPPGTTIEFENRDKVYHNVFSVSPASRFDVGRYAPGQVRKASFAREGVVHVFCELHPREVAYVVVAPDRLHAKPAADGLFAFAKVPSGLYLVRAFHPALGDVTKRVRVEPKKTSLVRFGS